MTKRTVHPALSLVTPATELLFANSRYSPPRPPKPRAGTWVGSVLEPQLPLNAGVLGAGEWA